VNQQTKFEPLRQGKHVDLAIAGGGIAGLTAAVLLKGRGKRVAVIEKAPLGESSGSAAQLTTAIDAGYHAIARTFGKDGARLVADANSAAI